MSTENTEAAGSPEYNQQMADKFQNQSEGHQNETVETPPISAIPEGGQAKFYNADTGAYDWQNHAREAEYRLNGNKTPEPKAEEQQQEVQEQDNTAADIVTSAGLDPMDLQTQLQNTGTLSEEAFEALAKVGLSRDLVETYAENFNYRQEGVLREATDYAGGEEGWQQLSQWATQNMPESEVNGFNQMLGTDQWKVAIDAIRARRSSSTGEPNMINGAGISGNSSSGYRSKSEMTADMSNPLYSTDPKFRQDVMRKMQTATWDLE